MSKIFESDIAFKYQYAMQTEYGLIAPSIKVGIAHNIQSKPKDLKYKLANGNDAIYPIQISGKKQTSVFAKPELLVKGDNFDLALSYKLEKAKKYTAQLFSAKVMAKF